MSKEIKGYRKKPGKLPFSNQGTGGTAHYRKLRELNMIPESEGGKKPQPKGKNRHDHLLTGSSVGRRTPLVDSHWKVTGQAKYGDDIRLPNELIGRILRSPHHYAKIKNIDTSEAEEIPGVLAIETGQQHTDLFGVLPVTKDEHAMADDKVRHVGD